MASTEQLSDVKALCFDVFGSVVDWRASLLTDITAYAKAQSIQGLDVPRLVDDWRGGYQPSMQKVRDGELPWTNLDDLHRMTLQRLLGEQGIKLDTDALEHVNQGWHRLKPWPDSVAGLTALRALGLTVTPLSNGNRTLLSDMAEHAGLPWSRILSAEDIGHYKPDQRVYLGATTLLGLEPSEVMMCAAHNYDLAGAREAGLRTAFWPRPTEYGPRQVRDLAPTQGWDIIATDIADLSIQMQRIQA